MCKMSFMECVCVILKVLKILQIGDNLRRCKILTKGCTSNTVEHMYWLGNTYIIKGRSFYINFLFAQIQIEKVERFAFYERAKKAFAVVHTGYAKTLPNKITTSNWSSSDTKKTLLGRKELDINLVQIDKKCN